MKIIFENLKKNLNNKHMGKKRFKKKCPTELSAGRRTAMAPKQKTALTYSVTQLLDKAEECIDEFNYEVAQKFCERALDMDPDNLRVLETSGSLLLELGNQEAAKHCFGRAVEISPDVGHAKYMYLGQLFPGAESIEFFQKGIELMIKEKQAQQEREVVAACSSSIKGKDKVTDKDISDAYCSIAEIYMTDCCFEDDAESRCKENTEKAIAADQTNPEAYLLMANFFMSIDDKQSAKDMVNKSLSLWLPQIQDRGGSGDTAQAMPQDVTVSYDTRLSSSKIFIELAEYDQASQILEGLLDENDQVSEVWYLLGWLNCLQGADYKGNARFYLNKAKKVYQKTRCGDKPVAKHIEELLKELGPDEDGDDENKDDSEGDDDDFNIETDSESEHEDTPMDQETIHT